MRDEPRLLNFRFKLVKGKGIKDMIKRTLIELAENAESHYLAYFMDNLSLEITTFYELISEDRQKALLEDNEGLRHIIEQIIHSMSDSQEWMTPSAEAVSQKISTLYAYREQLSDQVAVLAGYDDQLKMYQYILERRKDYGDNLDTSSDENFAGELVQYIFEYEDSMTINDRVKGVYGELPVRMSKLKFHEWVEKALLGMKGVSVNDLMNYTTYLKETYYPEGIKGYGEVAPEFYKEVNSLKVLLTDIVASEVVVSMDARIIALQRTLDDAVSLYTFTASVLNNMLGILSTLNEKSLNNNKDLCDSFTDLMTELHKRRKKEIIIDQDLVEIFDTISIRFSADMMKNGQVDGWIEEAKQGRLDEIISEGLEERFDRLASLYILQSSSYFAPVQVSAEDITMVNEVKLIQVKKELLAYLDQASEGNSRMEKRARIANLLAVLNVVHTSAQEIHAYLMQVLTACRDEREKQGCKAILRRHMTEI